MDNRGDQRPPRSARPVSHSRSSVPSYPDQPPTTQPPLQHNESSKAGVSFQNVELGDRHSALDSHKQRGMPSAYVPQLSGGDPEHSDQFDPSRVARKKSLVRPDREKIDPSHRQWHYRSHVAQLEEEGHGTVGVMPSSKCLVVCPTTPWTLIHFPFHSLISHRESPSKERTFSSWSRGRCSRIRSRPFQARPHLAEKASAIHTTHTGPSRGQEKTRLLERSRS